MGLTTQIEKFLLDMMNDTEKEFIEIGRNELAERFNCARFSNKLCTYDSIYTI